MTQSTLDQVKHAGDALATGGAFAAFMGWVPNITAVLALIYLVIRIGETRTVRAVCEWLRARFKETP